MPIHPPPPAPHPPRHRGWRLLLAAGLLLAGLVSAGQPGTPAPDGLRPGGYAWNPGLAPTGPLAIVVSLPAQRVYVYRNGVRIGTSTTSTGRAGHETPPGVYTILQKHREHRSNLYDDAPMPFMQRLTWDGVALHAGQDPGYPASHGCIRLPRGFAEALFGATTVGTPVVVADAEALPALSAPGLFLPAPVGTPPGPARLADGDGDGDADWAPERAPDGPVSVLLSTRDGALVVVRNGVEIGRTAVAVEAALRTGLGTYAWQRLDAADGADAAAHWMRLPVAGATPEGEATLRAAFANGGIAVPAAFARRLSALLQPGTTAIVTDEPLSAAGPRRDVLSTEDPEPR